MDRKPRGRPPTGTRKKRLSITLTAAAWRAADAYAERRGLSMSVAIDEMIVEAHMARVISEPVTMPDPEQQDMLDHFANVARLKGEL